MRFMTTENVELGLTLAAHALGVMHYWGKASKDTGYFVVLNATMPWVPTTGEDGRWSQGWENALLYRGLPGQPLGWQPEERYKNNAIAKASLAWRERMDTLEMVRLHPERLRSGDTRYAGGVYRYPLVIAFSGVQARLDHALSAAAAEYILALAALEAEAMIAVLESKKEGFIPAE